MNKATFIILSLAIASVCGQTCTGNHLQEAFGFQMLSQPSSGSTHLFCKSLQNGQSCCSDETVQSFQQKTDDSITRLMNIVAERDKFMIQTRKSLLDMIPTFQRLGDAAYDAVIVLRKSIEEPGETFPIFNMLVLAMAQTLGKFSEYFSDNYSEFKNNFLDYQKTRSTCVVELAKVQAAAWCLACDPSYPQNGLNGNMELEIGEEAQKRILGSCYKFILRSDSQNSILFLHYLRGAFEKMITALEKIAEEDMTGVQDFIMAFSQATNDVPHSNDAKEPVKLPDDCTPAYCPWIFTKLFANGVLNETLLAAGGAFEAFEFESSQSSRILDEDGRVLQNNGQWNPEDDEAGVNVTFEENPGQVRNDDLSALRNGVIACVLIAVVNLLL